MRFIFTNQIASFRVFFGPSELSAVQAAFIPKFIVVIWKRSNVTNGDSSGTMQKNLDFAFYPKIMGFLTSILPTGQAHIDTTALVNGEFVAAMLEMETVNGTDKVVDWGYVSGRQWKVPSTIRKLPLEQPHPPGRSWMAMAFLKIAGDKFWTYRRVRGALEPERADCLPPPHLR